MNRFKKLAAPVAGIALVAAGLASAAATDPIPNPLPNAVAGNVIKASDINDIATAVGILDERVPGKAVVENPTTGNVGVGITNPTSKLTVMGAADIATFTGTDKMGLNIRGADSSDDYVGIDFNTGDGLGDAPKARIAAKTSSVSVNGHATGSYLSFGTTGAWASGITNTAMTIDPRGYIGIGTETPNYLLAIESAGVNTRLSIKNTDGNRSDTVYGSANFIVGYDGANPELDMRGESLLIKSTGSTKLTVEPSGGVIVHGLSGTGNAYVCVNETGALSRSDTACN